jgi:signal transduction histidine kinase
MNVMTTERESMGSASSVAVSIIHDLRNPLPTIRASSEVLIRSGLSESQVRRIARNVQGVSVRMEELTDRLAGVSCWVYRAHGAGVSQSGFYKSFTSL